MTTARAEASAPAAERARFALAVLGAAAIAVLLDLRFHAPWRDELQAWALVRGSPSLAALFENLRPEAHPPLWYLLLDFAQLFSHQPLLLLAVHGVCACAAIFLLARYAPFPRWVRLCIASSYFVLFEYFAIARGYVLVELLAFACCVELRGRRRGLVLALLFALLAQAELQGALLGAGLCAAWLLLERASPRPASAPALAFGTSAWLLSAALCLFEVYRRASMQAAPESPFIPIPPHSSLFKSLSLVCQALVPIFARFGLPEWLDAHLALTTIFTCALLAALTATLLRSSVGLAAWLLPALLLFAVSRLSLLSLRHYGVLFIAFVAASWLAAPAGAETRLASAAPARGQRALLLILTAFFAAQPLAGIYSFVADLRLPRSAARAAAGYLEREQLTDLPIICDSDFTAMSVAVLVDRPCFNPAIQEASRFTPWGPRRRFVGPPELSSAVDSCLRISKSVLLVLNHPLDAPIPGATLLTTFLQAVEKSERFYLYRVTVP